MNTNDTVEELKREIRLTKRNLEQLQRLAAEKEKELFRLERELRDWQDFKRLGI